MYTFTVYGVVLFTEMSIPLPEKDTKLKLRQELTDGVTLGVIVFVGVTLGVTDDGVLVVVLVGV